MKLFPIGKRLQKWTLSLLLPAFALCGAPIQANPRGGVVVHGAADIAQVAANQLRIHQKTNNVIINWQDFSISSGNTTRFVQPNNGTALNRVTSGNVSQIHGQLKANANVYVINPNGIVIGANGVIDVGGRAVLSTLDIDNDDFLNGGTNRFYGNSTTGISNFGTISSANGDVVLLGGFVDNQGQIGAMNGTVAIGAGGDILLHEGAGAQISVRGASDYTGTGISNSGTIRGANAELKAHGNVYALAINNTGAIRATGADRSGGRVRLTASGGSSNINLGNQSSIFARAGADGGSVQIDAGAGDATIGGTIDATGASRGGNVSIVGNNVEQVAGAVVDTSGATAGGTASLDAVETVTVAGTVRSNGTQGSGGRVDVTAASVFLNDGARLAADGATVGGMVRVGGDFQGRDTGLREADSVRVEEGAELSADSSFGKAGTVIVWANHDTLFLGDASASAKGAIGNGGLVEISGKELLHFDGKVAATSVGGLAGTVLFDPGNIVIGAAGSAVPPLGSPVTDSSISVAAINSTLQGGSNVLIVTESGSIEFQDLGGGGTNLSDASAGNRDVAIQWTNSNASFGAFASNSIIVNNHIRTSGAGSISLLAGWGGSEGDAQLAFDPQTAWDYYMGLGSFGQGGGSIIVGNGAMNRHVEVGSRFGDTNVAGFDVRVIGSDVASILRYSMIGFHDGGQVFGPRLNRGGNFRLDMKVGPASGGGQWLLSDGLNTDGQAANGVHDPIVAIVGQHEVDVNGDGIMDGVRGVNSTGVVVESFIPYASHFNSSLTGNWWWQQIEDAGSTETKDPQNLGGLRPEHGAGRVGDGAHINVIARGSIILQNGAGAEGTGASIGHGGPNRSSWGGAGQSTRELGNETVGNSAFSHAGIEGGQMERRWSVNGSENDRTATSIARLAPVIGNINVLAGVDSTGGANVNRSAGTVAARFVTSGDVILRAHQDFKTSSPTSNSAAQIGHGGIGQFGEFYGDITVEAGGSVILEAGEATRAVAVIGHTTQGHASWNPPSNLDQQIRFFATTGDFDNPNLRRGELFSGNITTGFNPTLDPAADLRYTLGATGYGYQPDPGGSPNTWIIVGDTPGSGNFVPVASDATGTTLTGQFVNVNVVGGNETQRVINMNPLLYTQGLGTPGTHSQGRIALAPLTLSPNGPITVAALDGSIVHGFHGNIKVYAHNGNVNLRGYTTPSSVTGNFPRDTRYAAIGHGGRGFELAVLGSGYSTIRTTPSIPGMSAGTVTGNPEGREIVDYRYTTGNEVIHSGSRSYIGGVGGARNRASVFTSITGDIDVFARRDINLIGGNDIGDHTRIGHGGISVADYETSSFILGDIRVRAGGHINVIGGGGETNFVRAGNVQIRAYSQIGHGGYRNGFFGFLGDISVSAGGSILLRNGDHRWNYAMVGHGGAESFGQMGGEFVRNEHFWADGIESTIATVLTSGVATVDYASANGGVNASRDFTASGAGTLVGADRHTANISLVAGGGVTLNHMQEGLRQPPGRNGGIGNVDNQELGLQTRSSSAHIGHGGFASHVINANNTGTNYGAKIGNITVRANGGSIVLENGTGRERWSRIGHGLGASDRVDDGSDVGFVRAVELVGNISVRASGGVVLNADAANENERDENFDSLFGSAQPSRLNPVAIGHGGVYDNLDLVVLSRGEDVKGIAASSNISVVAGGSMSVLGGKGVEASYAQVGHGFASDAGNDRTMRRGVHTGFAGNISVSVGSNLVVRGNANAWSEQPSGIGDNEGRSVTGAFGAIGHGGYQLDAPSFGDITVYVGSDLSILAQRRTDPGTDTAGASPYSLTNPDTDAIASGFNFAKIGHFAVENGNYSANFADDVRDANQEGDITVVVGRNLTITGGTTPNVDTQTIYGAFAQIGHGGPSIVGNLEGDISVIVKQNITMTRGSEITSSSATQQALNNYVMIGHGDRLFDTGSSNLSIFNESAGFRRGDINLAAGLDATFHGALVGHADPLIANELNQATTGDLRVAVSRLNPFFGGEGKLTATGGTVFSSGGFGEGSMLQFFIPSRGNNAMNGSTRINEATATFATAPDDFAAPFNSSNGILAGRADEVYLTPDLWWDQDDRAAQGNIPGGAKFPTNATSGQGGSLAIVEDPGGFYNLERLDPGSLGDSVPLYRDANGVSGAGHYTIYYDAIDFVINSLPVQPGEPTIPIPPYAFDFRGLFFSDTYDAYFRSHGLLEDEEDDEEEDRVGPGGMTYYIYGPDTNQYSSYRVFGHENPGFNLEN